jgi:hypothetical protein
MIEFLRHTFGFCGEPHFNLWHIIFGGTGLASSIAYIKFRLFKKTK